MSLQATREEMAAYLRSINAAPAVWRANGLEPPGAAPAAPRRKRSDEWKALAAITEAAFQQQIEELAELNGWRWWHVTDSRRQAMEDWPDLVLVRDRVLYRELKTMKGKVTPGQQATLDLLANAGADACVWRPSDWDLIEQTLT